MFDSLVFFGVLFLPFWFLPFWSFYQLTRTVDNEKAYWIGALGCCILFIHPIKWLHASTWFFMSYICCNYERRRHGQHIFFLLWILTILDFIFFCFPSLHGFSMVVRYLIRAPFTLSIYHYLRL